MKKYMLLTAVLTLLFTGCSYKNKMYSNTFQKEVETDREECTQKEATYDSYDSKIYIKENCKLTYDGVRTEKYDQYEFSFGAYIGRSILMPIGGAIMLPFSLVTFDGEMIKNSFIMATYPVSGLFYKPKKRDFVSSYKLNRKIQTYQEKETLVFQDKVNIHPEKEMWIGDEKNRYPLELNDDLSYSISTELVNFFCEKKDSCILNIYKRDDDETLTKFSTINMKEF